MIKRKNLSKSSQKKSRMLVLLTVVLTLSASPATLGRLSPECESLINLVDPFIGTTGAGYGGGQMSPAAQVPFGALRLGPDTTRNFKDIEYRHCSGYNYEDTIIRAFSHTHLAGAGVPDLGHFGIMPTRHDALIDKLKMSLKAELWSSTFNKSSEWAKPGQYGVYLDDPAVEADFLAFGNFAGAHRYKWTPQPGGDSTPGILIDLCHAASVQTTLEGNCLFASLTVESNKREFSASTIVKGRLSGGKGGLPVFMHAVLRPLDSTQELDIANWLFCQGEKKCTTEHHSFPTSVNSTSGSMIGHVAFHNRGSATSSNTSSFGVELIVGISFIDEATAKENLQQALTSHFSMFAGSTVSDLLTKLTPSLTQNSIVGTLAESVSRNWCTQLKALHIDGFDSQPAIVSYQDRSFVQLRKEPDNIFVIIYSSLYRTLMSPTQYSESGGKYMGVDGLQRTVFEDRAGLTSFGTASLQHFSDLSLWDIFRTQLPWLMLTRPDVSTGVLRSMTAMMQQVPHVPVWMLANVDAHCMVGFHGLASFVESIYAGYSAYFDIQTIQKVALADTADSASAQRTDSAFYLQHGYVSKESSDTSASLTLSYAFDDHNVGVLSEYVGDIASAEPAYQRSGNYKNIWDLDRQLHCPRSADGSMQCPRTNIGYEAWNEYVEGDAEHYRWFVPHDIEGLIDQFPSRTDFENVLRNFFDKHVSIWEKDGEFLPNPYYWAGNEHDLLAPVLFNYVNCTYTQSWTRRLIDMHFHSNPQGLPGNDDFGTMSAYSLFTILGLYPQAGTSNYFIGSPRISGGKIFLAPLEGTSSDLVDPRPYIEVITHNNSEENVYVKRLLINGVEYTSPMIDRGILVGQFPVGTDMKSVSLHDPRRDPLNNPIKGSKLEFFMTNTPKSGLCAVF